MKLKQILSFFVPINIYKQDSKIHKSLEVTWNNGKLVLDTKNTNFSYGNLQKVLKRGLLALGYESITKSQNILILGVAGGSVIETLLSDFKYSGKITGVEIDAEIIEIANTYFNLDQYKNVEIIVQDAEIFVSTNTTEFDIIIIDIFNDNLMPDFLFKTFFIDNLKKQLTANGTIIFNTIVANALDLERNEKYVNYITQNFNKVEKIPFVEGDNELIIIKK